MNQSSPTCPIAERNRDERKVVLIDRATFYYNSRADGKTDEAKLPQKYFSMSNLKSETSITHMTKFQGTFISEKMTLSPGEESGAIDLVFDRGNNDLTLQIFYVPVVYISV